MVGEDLSKWQYWWEFNKNPYLRLKEAVHRGAVQTGSDDFYLGNTRRSDATDLLKPTEGQIRYEILPVTEGDGSEPSALPFAGLILPKPSMFD